MYQVVSLPRDGIGPEVTAAVRRILAAAEAPIEWQAGLAALEEGSEVLPGRVRSRRSGSTGWH
jgi:isocitrate dehydrogenase (NAD+)